MRQLGPGDEIGGYRIEAIAGRGGMGLVYRARQHRPDRIVAIKVIAPELAADPSFRARFEQESATAAEIEHPNVIPVYEVGDDDGLLFISMRFVHGVDLGRLLKETGPMPPERAARLIAEVADALDAAHACGLVHRDVKPGNILVTDRDHVYLTDFGLTKRTADSHGMTQTGMFVGTVDYVAPEQVEGRRLDARADIYALGCVAYEMLSGTVPFPRDSDVAKIFAHVNDPAPRLTNVPEPLAAAVQRAMAKRPEDRFQSAGDFGRAVIAGAENRIAAARERTVATGDAAISDASAPTELGHTPEGLAAGDATELATRDLVAAPGGAAEETAQMAGRGGPPRGGPPGSGSAGTAQLDRPRRRWPLAAGAIALVAVIGAGVAIAIASSGSNNEITTTTTTTQSGSVTTTSGGGTTSATTTTSSSTTSSLQATAKQIYSPANASGGLAVANPTSARGTCFTTSIVSPRSDAYRCMTGNSIVDPCLFVNATQVLCPTNGPWSSTGLLLNVPSLPNNSGGSSTQGTGGQPWAIELADGTRCEEASGATNVIAGQRLGYFCKGGVGLYGSVDKSSPVWTIFVGMPHSATLSMKPIAIAWF